MGRRQRRRRGETGGEGSVLATTDHTDAAGNVLTLRNELSPATIERLHTDRARAGASLEDIDARRVELLFERLAVRWEIAGLPLEGQAELLGRYRLADAELRRWVRQTVTEHARVHLPELRA